jgi:hypothetical protein
MVGDHHPYRVLKISQPSAKAAPALGGHRRIFTSRHGNRCPFFDYHRYVRMCLLPDAYLIQYLFADSPSPASSLEIWNAAFRYDARDPDFPSREPDPAW